MLEFRFHGRGGQGVVVLGKLVARLYFQLGQHVKEFPKFGVERRGAPVEGYVRVDDAPIDIACQIYHPHAIVVMAESILEKVDVTAGLAPASLILVNSPRPPEELREQLVGYRVATLDGAGLALAHGLGTALAPIVNTILFGAFARMMDVAEDELDNAIVAEVKRPGKNIAAAHAAYVGLRLPVELSGVPRARSSAAPLFPTLEALPDLAYSLGDALGNRTGSWRSQRPQYAFKTAPCNARCPAGNDVRGFLAELAANRPAAALEVLLRTSPLPGICGRVCPHPCEDECNRAELGGAVSVMALERYAADHGGDVVTTPAPATGKRIAIVGSGPAGLSAAWQLARHGHKVVVFESAPEPGGMLRVGIPEYRLPREVLRREILRIERLGVDIRVGTAVGRDVTLGGLQKEYNAVLVAVGQQESIELGLRNGEGEGVEHGLELLRRHNLGERVAIGDKVVVIGGGNTAIDVAGVCLRGTQSRDVTIVYRRSRAEMPAIPDEVDQACAEGAKLLELTAPVEVVRDAHGKVTGLICERMRLGELDTSGRRRPVAIPDSRHEIACDHVLFATGQRANLAFGEGLRIGKDKLSTDRDNLFVCGDAATEEGTVTAAIGSGRRAA
ncbi:MAG: FAD-dependent oxidoreductase, partial [Myxococcota bacterium]